MSAASKPIIVHKKPFEYDETLTLPRQFTGTPPTAILAPDPDLGWHECGLCDKQYAEISLFVRQIDAERTYRRQTFGICGACSVLPVYVLKKALRTLAIARMKEVAPAVVAFLRSETPKDRGDCQWELAMETITDLMQLHHDPDSTITTLAEVLRPQAAMAAKGGVA